MGKYTITLLDMRSYYCANTGLEYRLNQMPNVILSTRHIDPTARTNEK